MEVFTIHGENNYIVMFGVLHMKMAIWNTLGDLLEKSGWTRGLADADLLHLALQPLF